MRNKNAGARISKERTAELVNAGETMTTGDASKLWRLTGDYEELRSFYAEAFNKFGRDRSVPDRFPDKEDTEGWRARLDVIAVQNPFYEPNLQIYGSSLTEGQRNAEEFLRKFSELRRRTEDYCAPRLLSKLRPTDITCARGDGIVVGLTRHIEILQAEAPVGTANAQEFAASAVTSARAARGADWEDIDLLFVGEHNMEIHIRGKHIQKLEYKDIEGFENLNTGKPNKQWIMLRAFRLMPNGTMPENARCGKDWEATRKTIERTSDALRKHFKMTGNPIPYDKDARTYRARINIRDAPNSSGE